MNDLTPDQLARLQAAHTAFDRDHAAERDKLLAELPATPPTVPLSLWNKGRQMIRHNWAKGMVAAVLAVAAFGGWQLIQPPTAFGQVAKAMKAAGGYSFDMRVIRTVDGKEVTARSGRMVVSAAGDVRTETFRGADVTEYDIHRIGKPGVSVDHRAKTFRITEADVRPNPFLSAVAGLAKYTGAADDELGTKTVAGVKAKGYSLSLNRLVPEVGDKPSLEMWLDTTTNRPVRIDLIGLGQPDERAWFENFAWGNIDEKLFDTTPPAGYTVIAPKKTSVEETTDKIVLGLKTYAKYAGHYPKSKNIYGDTTRDELFAAAGFLHTPGQRAKDEAEKAEMMTDKWRDTDKASEGFGWINQLQRKNAGAAYYGKTVTPDDTGKVLFRWKLDGDEFRVIFGDLSSETVSVSRLTVLEK